MAMREQFTQAGAEVSPAPAPALSSPSGKANLSCRSNRDARESNAVLSHPPRAYAPTHAVAAFHPRPVGAHTACAVKRFAPQVHQSTCEFGQAALRTKCSAALHLQIHCLEVEFASHTTAWKDFRAKVR